ncbi:DEAD/DEAH box helicase [Parasphingorhabdus sp.]|jgi:superfamily II DNA/RNA helicase|uniref:DEAD/DEAH box helicase n=1 Tax=Parasphingorhabdus sp. TaxID=2709688 RepID=UPI003BB0C1BB
MKFADLGLSDELLQAVADAGYDEPTPIQAQAIPPVLMMKDIIGIAQTGTGKTASFVLPMIDILAHGRSRARMPRSLILEPTRELAAQVAENFEKYGKNHNLSMALLIGGVSMGDQIKALEKGVDVLIATPGRLMDLFERGRILMSGCELLVIDEADRMLDMGFIPDIEQICSKLPSTRQTMLFSATMPPPIKKLSDQFLNNPKSVEVSRPATANTSIDQSIIHLAPKAKRQTLYGILDNDGVDTAIIFCNRKTEVRDLCEQMRKDGFDAGQIHGDMDQSSRLAELERFKSGEINILCASDVAARGLDIKGVSHVVNYDIPWHPDDYIHRIGRTGRAGATGVAITFVTKRDDEHVDSIEKLTGMKLPVRDLKSIKPEKKQSGKKTVADKPKSEKPKKPHSDDRRADKPKRPEKSAKPAKSIPKPETADETDDGWNGPVPGFLGAKFDR